jgi:hypothetical protein
MIGDEICRTPAIPDAVIGDGIDKGEIR